MEAIKRRLGYVGEDGVDRPLYLETSSDMVYRTDGSTLEQTLQATAVGLAGVDSKIAAQTASAKSELMEELGKESDARDTQVKAVRSDLDAAKADLTNLQGETSANKTSLEELIASSISGLVDNAPESMATLNKLATAITALKSVIDELTADSGDTSIKGMMAVMIASIVADAPEDLNTLKEVSDWIYSHEDDASAMNSKLQDLIKSNQAIQTKMDQYFLMNIS